MLRLAPAMSVQLTPSFSGVLGSGSQPMHGGSLSVTVTVKEQVVWLPASSSKGNSFLKAGMDNPQQGMQHFQQAVQSYQEALKLDPKNDDTRYNLAYARRLLQQAQQQQQNQQGQGQNQDQNNQNGQNQQNQQNKDQQNKGNQNQQNQNQQGDQKDQKDTQKRPNQMEHRKQDAERMLEAVKNNERQSLKEQAKKVQAANSHPSDKDW